MSFSFGDSGGGSGGGFSFGSDNKSSGGGGGFGGDSNFSFGSDKKSGGSSDFSFGSNSSSNSGGFGSSDKSSSDFNFGGSSGGGGFGFSNSSSSSNNSMLIQRVHALYDAYNPESPRCCFNHFFYNAVTAQPDPQLVKKYLESLVKQYSKSVPERLWFDAWKANKNPSRLVPVPARSFGDLQLRIEEQSKRSKAFITTLQSFENRLEKIRSDHRVKTLNSIEELKEKHQKLSGRVLKTQKMVEVLMQKGVGLSGVDNQVKTKLDEMQELLHKPNEFRGRLNDLAPQFLQYVKDEQRSHVQSEKLDDPVLMDRFVKFLAMQTEGLKHLSTVLKKDLNDMVILDVNKMKL
jgi:nuclear pore complex protein Nup54